MTKTWDDATVTWGDPAYTWDGKPAPDHGEYEWWDGTNWVSTETFVDHVDAANFTIPAAGWGNRDLTYEIDVAVEDQDGARSEYSNTHTLNPMEWWDGTNWVSTETWISHTDIDSIDIPAETFDFASRYKWTVNVEDGGGLQSGYAEDEFQFDVSPLQIIAANDTLNLSVGLESTALYADVYASASDALTVSLVDVRSGAIEAILAASETLSVGLVDVLSAIAGALSVSDNASVGVTDAVSALKALLDRSDSLNIGINDVADDVGQIEYKTTNDDLGVLISDSATVVNVFFATDNLIISVGQPESTEIDVYVASTDHLGLVGTEGKDLLRISSAADTLNVAVVDTQQLTNLAAAVDELRVGILDAVFIPISVLLNAQDSLTVGVFEPYDAFVFLQAGDSVVVSLSDASSLNISTVWLWLSRHGRSTALAQSYSLKLINTHGSLRIVEQARELVLRGSS